MTLLIVDGNNLAMRGIHAMARSALTADGVSTGPLMVFINSLSRHVREEKPDQVVVCWDSGPSEFRLAIDPNYKAHRAQVSSDFDNTKRSAFGMAKEFLALSNVLQVERRGYEADDLIARYHDLNRGTHQVILSSDKDFLQLLDDTTEQIRLSSGGAATDRWTKQRVLDEFGCSPANLTDAMSLAGDDSDGVPGVPRFGMKTAIKTLTKYDWSLQRALDEHPALAGYQEQVARCRRLVDLRTARIELDLPAVSQWRPTMPDSLLYEGYISFLTRYQLESVKKRVYDNTLWFDA